MSTNGAGEYPTLTCEDVGCDCAAKPDSPAVERAVAFLAEVGKKITLL